MKKHLYILVACAGLTAATIATRAADAGPVLHIQADEITTPFSPLFSGMMTEEINHSYDGGLYAELIQNRVFKDDTSKPVHWSLAPGNGAAASMALDPANGLNEHLAVSLRVDVTAASESAPVKLSNDGYWGIPAKPGTRYRASFYAKAAANFSGPVEVSIESGDGTKIFAHAKVKHLSTDWQKYSVTLTTDGKLAATSDVRFVLSATSPGTVWFDLVSLFPPTWHDRPNGNRIDLMQKLADMKPRFLRFPGGNYLEGSTIDTRFPWKETLGDLSQRPGHPGCWGYRSSDGLGLLEFLEWAEDLGSEPVLAVYAGYSLPPKSELVKAGPALQPFVDDALDEIEYVIGDKTTKWGARRIADGHPAPFPLKYVEIGNEDWFDKSGSYDGRFAQFYDAIKAKYPQLQCISTVGNEQPEKLRVHSRKPDVLDEHYYNSVKNFEMDSPGRFEKYDRNGPKIFVGEWAAYEDVKPWEKPSQSLPPTPNYKAALGDAVWMSAMERNSDIIVMQCYAPMLVNVNPGGRQWRPNLIGYDNLNSYGSPSYHVISMYNANHGDVVVRASLSGFEGKDIPAIDYSVTKDKSKGVLFIKIVNVSATEQSVKVQIEGVKKAQSEGTSVMMKCDNLDIGNTIPEPTRIAPVTEKIGGLGAEFTRTYPPYSITVLKVKTR